VTDDDEFVRWVLLVIQNTPLLDADEEMALLTDLRGPEIDARTAAMERLRLSLFRIVLSVARKYAGAFIHLAEPLRSGFEGIGPALEGYDHQKALKLSVIAAWHVRRAIDDAGFVAKY
jgi:DNA-directed RNA polymerase sigma subunit (sigma70/sigma32)